MHRCMAGACVTAAALFAAGFSSSPVATSSYRAAFRDGGFGPSMLVPFCAGVEMGGLSLLLPGCWMLGCGALDRLLRTGAAPPFGDFPAAVPGTSRERRPAWR